MAVTDSVGVGLDPVMRGNALKTDTYRRGDVHADITCGGGGTFITVGEKANCVLTDAVSREA